MTKPDLEAILKKHKGNKSAAAREAGLSVRTFQRYLNGERPQKERAPKVATAGRSLSEFRAAHDKNFIIPQKIKDALKALGEGWEYEAAFIRLAGISQTDMGNFREQFTDHVVLVDRTKRVWAGTKAAAAKLREMVS